MFLRPAITVLVLLWTVKAEPCVLEVFRKLSRCDDMWGYNAEAGLGVSGRGNVINVTALLNYCGNPRQNLGQCFREAYGDCDPGWSEEERPVFEETMDWTSKSLDYLCAEADTIRVNKECLESVSGGINQCIGDSVRTFNEEFGNLIREESGKTLPWEAKKSVMERFAVNRETCVYALVRDSCNSAIGDVFGNFFYGSGTYVYDEANQRH